MGFFDTLKNQRLREQAGQATAAARAKSEFEEIRRLTQALADRFSPIVVPVIDEFLEAVGWDGIAQVQIQVNVQAESSEVVWVVPCPGGSSPLSSTYALVTVCLVRGGDHFICYFPSARLNPECQTPTGESRLTAESLAATLTGLYRNGKDERAKAASAAAERWRRERLKDALRKWSVLLVPLSWVVGGYIGWAIVQVLIEDPGLKVLVGIVGVAIGALVGQTIIRVCLDLE